MQRSPFLEMGGEEAIRRVAARFYEIMAEDPAAARIRGMHAEDLGPIVDKLSGFMMGWLGGPRDYFDQPEAPCIMSVHRAFDINEADRDQWMTCMKRALDEEDLAPEFRRALESNLLQLANGMRSR